MAHLHITQGVFRLSADKQLSVPSLQLESGSTTPLSALTAAENLPLPAR